MKSRKIERIGTEFRGKKQEKLKRYKLEYANDIFVTALECWNIRIQSKMANYVCSSVFLCLSFYSSSWSVNRVAIQWISWSVGWADIQ